MRISGWIAFVFTATSLLAQQEPALKTRSDIQKGDPVYLLGPDISTPVLQPLGQIQVFTQKCKQKVQGTVQLSFLVNKAGQSRDVALLQAVGNDLDVMALRFLRADHFTPARKNGEPVVVAIAMEIKLKGCYTPAQTPGSFQLHLLEMPEQRMIPLVTARVETFYEEIKSENQKGLGNAGLEFEEPRKVAGGVKAPKLIYSANAQYTEEGRKAIIDGKCNLTLIVDPSGMPQNLKITQPLGYGMDENVLESVRHYRFTPARDENGTPVPVIIQVEVSFHKD